MIFSKAGALTKNKKHEKDPNGIYVRQYVCDSAECAGT